MSTVNTKRLVAAFIAVHMWILVTMMLVPLCSPDSSGYYADGPAASEESGFVFATNDADSAESGNDSSDNGEESPDILM